MSDKIEFTNLTEAEVTEDNPEGVGPERPDTVSASGQGFGEGGVRRENTPLRERAAAQRAEGLQTIIIGLCIFGGGVTIALIFQLAAGHPQLTPHGSVATCDKRCSAIAIEAMKKGGSSVDAAIAASLCASVVHPQLSGIGGGGLMIIHDHKKHENTLFDFLEVAPGELNDKSNVGVPGMILGLWKAHRRFGKLFWKDLFQPAIKLAKDGFYVNKGLEFDYNQLQMSVHTGSAFAQLFQPIQAKEYFKMELLAEALRLIAEDGPTAFYNESIAESIITATDGAITAADLSDYKVEERDPITAEVNGYVIAGFPSPAPGALLARAIEKLGKPDVNKEAVLKEAYKCRGSLGDPDFNEESSTYDALLANSSIPADICDKVSVQPDLSVGSHVSVIDQNELIVSVSLSLGSVFGSKTVTNTGIVLNDRLAAFDEGSEVNKAEPMKRPFSPLVPTVVYHRTRPCNHRVALGAITKTGLPSANAVDAAASVIKNLIIDKKGFADSVLSDRTYCDQLKCHSDTPEKDERESVVAAVMKSKTLIYGGTDKVGQWRHTSF